MAAQEEFSKLALAELEAIYRLARHLAPRSDQAEDCVQETYLRAFRSAASYQHQAGGPGIRPWLFQILHNVVKDRVSADHRQRELTEGLWNQEGGGPATGPASEAAAGGGDGRLMDLFKLNWDGVDERLKAAIAELPLALRTPFLLFAAGGLRYRQIAEVIDVPVGTVMSRMYRARQILCSRLAGLAAERGMPPKARGVSGASGTTENRIDGSAEG